MQAPIRFDASLESMQPDEEEVQADMIRVFDKIQETTLTEYGHAVRSIHAKSHGLLTGRLTVLPDLPAPLAQGLCAAPGTYDVVLRLPTNPGDILDDSVPTPCGLAVMVIGVPGERLPEAEEDTQVDDGLAFSPWHGIAAHRPLGSVMRARRAVYPRSAGFRFRHNGCPVHEPTRA